MRMSEWHPPWFIAVTAGWEAGEQEKEASGQLRSSSPPLWHPGAAAKHELSSGDCRSWTATFPPFIRHNLGFMSTFPPPKKRIYSPSQDWTAAGLLLAMPTSIIYYIQWKICLNTAGTSSQFIISTISIHACWSFVKVRPNKSARPRNVCHACV